MIVDNSFDLMILDINVPTKNGFEILEELNDKQIYLFLLFLSQHLVILKIFQKDMI